MKCERTETCKTVWPFDLVTGSKKSVYTLLLSCNAPIQKKILEARTSENENERKNEGKREGGKGESTTVAQICQGIGDTQQPKQ